MNKALCIPSVRFNSLDKLLWSIKNLDILKDWNIYVYFQSYSDKDLDSIFKNHSDIINDHIISENRIAPYIARCELMKRFDADIYCMNDDDAVFMNMVNYETPCYKILSNSKIGMISTNWVRVNTPKMMAKKRYENKYISQKIVNTGGGLLFSRKVAEIILKSEIKAYLYDDIMLSLNAYVNGYKNYRYLGSIVEHNAVMKGGIKTLYKEKQMELLPKDLISMKKTTSIYPYDNNNYHMPTSRDLTQLADNMHKINYENI